MADTNRDGLVDIEGDTDILAKTTWTQDRGALFLANIADTNQRCSSTITNATPDADLDKCHDASDDVLRQAKYLAPLRTLPDAGLSAEVTGSVRVAGEGAQDKVRIFVKSGSAWEFVASNYTFTADELRGGLELGIDARDVRRPDGWDGKANVHFSITDGVETASDEVALRVAPLLTHHHAQQAEKVFATSLSNNPQQRQFVEDLEAVTADAGLPDVFRLTGQDIWTQDFFEPGYSSIPGPEGPIVLRIMIRSAQRSRSAGRQVFRVLRSEDVGAVQFFADGDTIDSTGNLETIPPYTHNGVSYPAGRIIMGAFGDRTPKIFPLLEAQQTQAPLALDTSWLFVGHVDEFLQFLPVDSERGWVLMADDPLAGLEILSRASEAGHGSKPAFSRPSRPSDANQCIPHTTIDHELEREDFKTLNEHAAERIQANIDILKQETGITDEEIFRVPALFYVYDPDIGSGPCVAKDIGDTATSRVNSVTDNNGNPTLPSIITAGGGRHSSSLNARQVVAHEPVLAHYPGTINGVVLSDSFYLAPNPWGPVVDGEDIFAKAVTATYAQANYNVTYMDDWFSHHIYAGEIHCGSNTWRNTDAPWW